MSGASLLPFSDAFMRADGAIGNGWNGATWTISGNKVINTPALGAELFLTPDFAADANWTKGTGWTIAAGVASKAAGTGSFLTQNVASAGIWYRFMWTLLNRTGGSFRARITNLSVTRVANGTYVDSIRAGAVGASIDAFQTSSAGDVDNASLKALTLSELFATKNFGAARVASSIKATIVSGNPCGLIVNLDSASSPANFVIGYHDGATAKLDKCVAGTYTNLISATTTYSAGAAIEIKQPSAGTYQLWYNSVQVGADQSVADAAILAATLHGMFQAYEGNSLDDFSILAN